MSRLHDVIGKMAGVGRKSRAHQDESTFREHFSVVIICTTLEVGKPTMTFTLHAKNSTIEPSFMQEMNLSAN